jgi:lipoate-protein ligase A
MMNENGFTQMAVDEAILNSVIEDRSPPTIRFFNFTPPSITLGRLQRSEEVNIEKCSELGIDVVRRITGGRAVIHCSDFTFSLIFKRTGDLLSGSVYETYREISSFFHRALQSLGIPTEWHRGEYKRGVGESLSKGGRPFCFSAPSRYELLIGKEKVLGISQYRKKNSVLVQGTLLLDTIPGFYADLFHPPITLDGFTDINTSYGKEICFNTFRRSLEQELRKSFPLRLSRKLRSFEERDAERIEKKYRSLEWTQGLYSEEKS